MIDNKTITITWMLAVGGIAVAIIVWLASGQPLSPSRQPLSPPASDSMERPALGEWGVIKMFNPDGLSACKALDDLPRFKELSNTHDPKASLLTELTDMMRHGRCAWLANDEPNTDYCCNEVKVVRRSGDYVYAIPRHAFYSFSGAEVTTSGMWIDWSALTTKAAAEREWPSFPKFPD